MTRIVVNTHVTLDGVMQAPGQPDEDTRGGFAHGGWQRPYNDPVMGEVIGAAMASAEGMLLGRRTYESFGSFWPSQPPDNPIAAAMNGAKKFVASRTLREPLTWSNSTLLSGDAAQTVAGLRARPGGDLSVVGSGNLVQTLVRNGLVDEYVVMLHPLVLGGGSRLFEPGLPRTELELIATKMTTTGVVILTYRPLAAR